MSGSAPPAPPGPPTFALQVASGIHGAFLLARGRAEGFAFACLSAEGPGRSLFAMALCAPAYLALRLMLWGEGGGGGAPGGADPGVAILSDLAGYAAGWGAYGLASRFVAEAWGRAALWPRYLAGWAWCSVPQHAAALLGALLPGALGTLGSLAAFGWAIWLAWFVARAGLRLDGPRAAALVAVEVALGLFAAEVASAVARP